MRYSKFKNFFCLLQIFFKIREILRDEMLARSKFFPQFIEKIEKLKLSLSKQQNEMLKIRSEMLKIMKNVKIIKLGKISESRES